MDFDALVVGAGPAGMIIAAALAEQGVNVGSLTASPLRQVWPNTYGIWRDELEALGLTDLLGHCWDNCVSYFGKGKSTTVVPTVYSTKSSCKTTCWPNAKLGE